MKVYVAGKWEDRRRCRDIMDRLEDTGHTITCDWTDHEYEDEQYPIQYCQDDVQGVKDADVFLGVFIDNTVHYRGALVEMGIALGLGLPCYIIGNAQDDCIFINHPQIIKVANLRDMLNLLKRN